MLQKNKVFSLNGKTTVDAMFTAKQEEPTALRATLVQQNQKAEILFLFNWRMTPTGCPMWGQIQDERMGLLPVYTTR